MRFVGLLLAMVGVFAFTTSANARFLPPNNLHLLDNINGKSNVTEAQFHEITNTIIEVWKPFAAMHGAELVGVADWEDSTVNAYADQAGKKWSVHMFGGLARREEVTPDGFALVVCHELGHHFAGYAFYGDADWAASEGESDYWATQVCAQKIWGPISQKLWGKMYKDNFRHLRRGETRSLVQARCEQAWQTPDDVARCNRITDAGIRLATLLAHLGGAKDPQLDTPDTSEVDETSVYHPEGQCRLDTYAAGAVCSAKFDLRVIPGRNHPEGQVSKAAEAEAAKYSCFTAKGDQFGFRPRCWFKPLVSKFFRR